MDLIKEKDDLIKKNVDLKLQLADLWRLAASIEDEKRKVEGLQSLYDFKCTELSELKQTHTNLVNEHNAYCNEVELHIGHVC